MDSLSQMHPVIEGHPQIVSVSLEMELIQTRPTCLEDPVLAPEGDLEQQGVSIYGSVIRENVFRMWYTSWPREWSGSPIRIVSYAESDDGIHWRRPSCGLVEYAGSKQNNLLNLPFTSPSVVIDPTAAPESRYRAFGAVSPGVTHKEFAYELRYGGYYSAHSADGIDWHLDSDVPIWASHDVMSSVWDPSSGCVRLAMKDYIYQRGVNRRSIFTAEFREGVCSRFNSALIPDEFDDVVATSRGYRSGDYYGMGFMSTPGPLFGFLWNFRHRLPLHDIALRAGSFGPIDLSLVYQIDRNGQWLHFPGRPDWFGTDMAPPWASNCIYTASSAIDVGDETWLYFSGSPYGHNWYNDNSCKRDQRRWDLVGDTPHLHIGLLKWPRNRLTGYKSALLGTIRLRPEFVEDKGGGELTLNVCTKVDGSARVALFLSDTEQPNELGDPGDLVDGYSFDDCQALSGDHMETRVTWRGKSQLPEVPENKHLIAVVEVIKGTVYAFRFTVPRTNPLQFMKRPFFSKLTPASLINQGPRKRES